MLTRRFRVDTWQISYILPFISTSLDNSDVLADFLRRLTNFTHSAGGVYGVPIFLRIFGGGENLGASRYLESDRKSRAVGIVIIFCHSSTTISVSGFGGILPFPVVENCHNHLALATLYAGTPWYKIQNYRGENFDAICCSSSDIIISGSCGRISVWRSMLQSIRKLNKSHAVAGNRVKPCKFR